MPVTDCDDARANSVANQQNQTPIFQLRWMEPKLPRALHGWIGSQTQRRPSASRAKTGSAVLVHTYRPRLQDSHHGTTTPSHNTEVGYPNADYCD